MKLNRFQRWALATLIATLLLIFIGGFVRVSGAGLGCPDWPKCWGSWWPPSSVESIDSSLYPVDEFNHTKMWIEYANRIVGVIVGFLVFGTFLFSFHYWSKDRWLVAGAGAALLMVGFEGWLGGKVVESELAGGMVTIHLAGAVVLFGLLIWVAWRSAGELARFEVPTRAWRVKLKWLAWVVFLCSTLQMLLGAKVREALDVVAASGMEIERSGWVEQIGEVFVTHRSFAWVLVLLAVVAMVWAKQSRIRGTGLRVVILVPLVVLAQIVTGAALAYFAIPGWAQVLHLGLSAVLCCAAFWMILGFSAKGGEVRDER